MPQLKRFRPPTAVLLLLATLCFLPLAASQPPAKDPDDQQAAPGLTIIASLNENGALALTAYSPAKKDQVHDIRSTLEAAFACAFHDTAPRTSTATTYFGKCQLPYSRSGVLHEYRFATAPLRDYAAHHQLELIGIPLTLPNTEARETIPATQGLLLSRLYSAKFRTPFDTLRTFSWRTADVATMPEFVVRTGYDTPDLARRAALLLSAILLPILLAFWLRHRALHAELPDRPSVWFSYIRCQQWLLNGSLLLWWAGTESTHLSGYLRFVLPSGPWQFSWLIPVASALANWIPPAAVWVACMVISQPVQEKLRGLTWTRKELGLQAIYSLCAALLPLLLIIRGIASIASGDFRSFALWLLAAFVIRLIAAGRLLKLLGMQPQALTTGELRDAAFNMAHRLGVKLQQVYVIPAGKGQMANAFARKGNTIAFTDYLLQRMTRREVNYILGHELTHLRLKHPQKLSAAIVGSLFLCVTAFMIFRASIPDSILLRYALFFAFVTVSTYFWSRRFEFAADAGAVATTADPEAAISALFKLSSLNMHPLQWSKWSEKWLTHPSTLRRAHAIAKAANIAAANLQDIACSAVNGDAHYSIPDSAISGKRLHSSTKKMSDVRWITLTLLGAKMLIPAGFGLVVKVVPMSPSADRLVYLAGAAATLAAFVLLMNVISTRRLRSLIPRLKSKLQDEGLQVDAWEGVPVALAPAALPRLYQGHSHWDLGFLFLRGDYLCYWGEETRFALRRDQISDIKLGPGVPNLIPLRRVYIAWRDTGCTACGVFSLASAEPITMLGLRRNTNDLFSRLLQWHKASSREQAMPQPLDSLISPQFGNVTGTSPLALGKPQRILRDLYLTALTAAGIALIAGLPFHVLDFFADPTGLASRPHTPGSGWYVVLVAVTVRIIQYLPYLRYKDVPVVQATLPQASQHQSPGALSGQKTRETERALP